MKLLKKLGLFLMGGALVLGVGFSLTNVENIETKAAGANAIGAYRFLASAGSISDTSFTPFTKSGAGWAAYGTGATAAEATTYSVLLGTKTIRTGTQGDYIEYLNITDLVNATSVTSVTVSIKTKTNTTTAANASEFTIQGYNGANAIADASITVTSDYGSLANGFTAYYTATTWKNAVLSTALGNRITGVRVTHSKKASNTLFTDIDVSWDGVVGSSVTVTGVEVDPEETSIPVGEQAQLTANVLPENATNKDVSWSSDDPDVASVDANGLVTGVSVGTAQITATTDDQGKTAYCSVVVTAGPSYDYLAAENDIPGATVNGSYVTLGGLDWSVSWTNGLGASTVGVSTFDGIKGFHFGTGTSPTGSVTLRSRLFVSPSNSSTQISLIIVEMSTASANKAFASFAVSVGGVLIDSYAPTDAGANTAYSYTPSSNIYGHIEIVMTNTSSIAAEQAALYIKRIKVFSNNNNADLAAGIVFGSALEDFNSCGDGTGYSGLLTSYSALNTTAKGYLSSIMLDDKNALGQAAGASVQKDIISAADKWAYVYARFGEGSGALDMSFTHNDLLYTIVIISILGITAIGAAFYLKKRKEA